MALYRIKFISVVCLNKTAQLGKKHTRTRVISEIIIKRGKDFLKAKILMKFVKNSMIK